MKVPQERATAYTISVVVVALLVLIVIAAVTGIVLGTAAFVTS